jgi:hypothetical protein
MENAVVDKARSLPPSNVIKRLLGKSKPTNLEEWRSIAIQMMQSERPTASEALELAEMLVGQWPYLNAHDPETYSLTLAAVFRDWPIMIAEECCDPRTGLARKREMPPTPASVIEWCAARSKFHEALSQIARRECKQVGGTK